MVLKLGLQRQSSEDDYYDAEVKERNRTLIPFINSKLPKAGERLIHEIDEVLTSQGGWKFNRKTRLTEFEVGFDQFSSLSELLSYLKQNGDKTGAGTICRIYPTETLPSVDVDAEFELALANFGPLLARCAPSSWDTSVRRTQDAVESLSDQPEILLESEQEGKQRILAEIARRHGQAKFREALFEAYDGKCAITRTDVPDVLQAAHIRPYNGPKTNHVTNGLLLRADVHNLFDLKLIRVEPNSLTIRVSPRLRESGYWKLEGRKLRTSKKASQQPDREALIEHFQSTSQK